MTLLGLGAALSVLFPQADKLTLDKAIELATKNSFSLKSADATIRSNEQKVREAKGQIGPRLSTNLNYLRYGKEQSADFGGNQVVFQPLDLTTWTSQLTLPIDVVGMWAKNKQGAQAGVDSSKDTRRAAENDLRQQVRKAYLQALRTKNLVAVAEQGNHNIITQVDVAEKKLREGVIARIDVERLKTQKVASDADVVAAKNNHLIAKQVLNVALSRPVDTEFEIEDVNINADPGGNYEDLLKLGTESRPEVSSLTNTIKALSAARTMAGQGLLPSLNLAIQNQRTLDPAGLNPQTEVNTTTLQLAVPIYDSGIAKARRAQTDEQIVQTQQSLLQTKLGISQEVRTALTNMENALTRLNAGIEQVRLANEVARIARVRRDAGEGTVLEIIDAETGVVNAENAKINAQFDYLAAFADLQRAVGNDNPAAALRAAKTQKETKSK